jgi:hypothetical protein
MSCKTVRQETYEVLDSIERMTRRIRLGLEDVDVDAESEELLDLLRYFNQCAWDSCNELINADMSVSELEKF